MEIERGERGEEGCFCRILDAEAELGDPERLEVIQCDSAMLGTCRKQWQHGRLSGMIIIFA